VLVALLPDIDALTGQEVPGLPPLDPQSAQVRLFRAVVAMLRRQCQARPVVVILEDLQWVRSNSLALLNRLSSVATGLPLLILGNYRDDERPHLPEELPRMQAIKLKRLAETAVAELSASMLGPAGRERQVVELLQRETEGNPFFLVEVVRALAEQTGRLEDVGRAPLPEQVFAGGVQEVVQRRLGRVPSWARPLLRLAAAVGREMDLDVLHALAPEVSLYRWLRACADVAVLETAGGQWRFAHHELRDGVLNALPDGTRRGLHRQVAETLEHSFPDWIEGQVERLAHHWEQAGETGKALPYLAKAGQKAAERYANQEALDYFGRALAHVQVSEEYDRILGQRAKILLDQFRGQEAARDYEQLLESAKRSRDRGAELEAMLGLAWAYHAIALDAQDSDFASRFRELCEGAYTLARELDDKASMVRALVATEFFHNFWPEYDDQAAANIAEALALSQEIGDAELIIDSRMAMVRHQSLRECEEQGEELLHLLESRHDLLRLKEVYWRLMWTHLSRGNLSRCVECCDAGIHLAAELGAPPVMYPTLKALALIQLGRYDAAWESLQDEVASATHAFGRAFKDFGTGTYFLELMAYEKAVETFESVIGQARRLKRVWMRHGAQIRLAQSLIRAGRLDEVNLAGIAQDLESIGETLPPDVTAEIALGEGKLDQALRRTEIACAEAKGSGRRPDQVSASELRLRVLLRLGRPGDVISLADEVLQMAEEMGYRAMAWRIRATKAQARGMLGDEQAARQEYELAAAIIRELAHTIPDAELKYNYLSNAFVSSIIAASSDRSRREQ
jgi:tetratricopeptide (TPR) repeat protein